MYSSIKNVQIILSLLKQHGIRHLVLSAGTRHVPIAHSAEQDPFFRCYSVVDERSAGYYALGLAKELREPVAIACTSSTATCNYTPAIAEAYYQKIPLLILTGDRDERLLGQLEDQMIQQVNMYKNFCKYCVDLPVVRDEMDEWYCTRVVNEAILELTHHGCGPVQINFQINQPLEMIADASVSTLPQYNMIRRIDQSSNALIWQEITDRLTSCKRILVLCGSSLPITDEMQQAMNQFGERFNCVFVTEHLSNSECCYSINAYTVAETLTGLQLRTTIAPDLVIFYGGNFISRWKTLIRDEHTCCTSWAITPDGMIVDPFRNLTHVFECSPTEFFKTVATHCHNSSNNKALYNSILKLKKQLSLPQAVELITYLNEKNHISIPANKLTGFGAMQSLAAKLPPKSLLHLSILNSTRIMQLFDLPVGVSVYSNIGTDGIDGCMSTFLGQAAAVYPRSCYLVIGDLSFFYDMNALSIRDIGTNVHILLINNGGGAEFYLSMGPQRLPDIDLHISAAHNHSAKAWAENQGFIYYSASTQIEFDNLIPEFVADHERPVLFEAYTDKLTDVTVFKGYRSFIGQEAASKSISQRVKNVPLVRQMLDTAAGQKIKSIIKNNINR